MNNQIHSVIRKLSPDDSIPHITSLLHTAYKPLAEQGFKYYATHQPDEITHKRLHSGIPFVATHNNRIIATITLVPPESTRGCQYYDLPHVTSFTQFAVHPDYQSQGLGSRLLTHIEKHAQTLNFETLALDTAENAHHLINYYAKRGYTKVGDADWDVTNYKSIIMAKPIPPTR